MHLHKAREIRYKFVYENSSKFHMEKMCKILDIKRSSYYAWLKRPMTKRKKDNNLLAIEIKRVNKQSHATYGARRITAQLKKDGIVCGKNRVLRLMKENNILSKLKRKYKITTYSDHNFNVTPNLLKQDSKVEEPNKVYVGNITYIGIDEGWLYLSIVMDLFNRELVGW